MKDVSDELEKIGKSAGLGCYYEELYHQKQFIGTWGYNGVHIRDKNYCHTETPEDGKTRVAIFQITEVEPQVPL